MQYTHSNGKFYNWVNPDPLDEQRDKLDLYHYGLTDGSVTKRSEATPDDRLAMVDLLQRLTHGMDERDTNYYWQRMGYGDEYRELTRQTDGDIVVTYTDEWEIEPCPMHAPT